MTIRTLKLVILMSMLLAACIQVEMGEDQTSSNIIKIAVITPASRMPFPTDTATQSQTDENSIHTIVAQVIESQLTEQATFNQSPSTPASTLEVQMIKTAAAQTFVVQLTQTKEINATQPTISFTKTPTATAEPGPIIAQAVMNANCREGPGIVYGVVEYVIRDNQVLVEGRINDASWFLIRIDDEKDHCWVSAKTITIEGDPNTLAIFLAPPTPTATVTPIPTPTKTRKPAYP